MAALMPQGKQQYFTAGGIPLVGGKVYTYAAGTTTPLATYTTAAASTPNTNPVILDSRGEASIFFSAANYKIVVKDSLDSTIWTQDNLQGDFPGVLAASTGSSLVGYQAIGLDSVPTSIDESLRTKLTLEQFGAVGDGVTDDAVAFGKVAAAINLAGGGTLVLHPGKTYYANTAVSAAIVFALINTKGFLLDGNGATIKTGSTNAVKRIFNFSGCTNSKVQNLNLVSQYASLSSDDGIIWTDIKGGSKNTSFENCTFTYGLYGINCTGTGETLRVRSITAINCTFTSVYYPQRFETNGDDYFARGIVTRKCGRSYFPVNVINHDVWMDSQQGGPFSDVLLKCYTSADTVNYYMVAVYPNLENINLHYKTIGRYPGSGDCINVEEGTIAIDLQLLPGSTRLGVVKNIQIDADIVNSASDKFSSNFVIRKYNASSQPDPTNRSHLIKNIRLSGNVENAESLLFNAELNTTNPAVWLCSTPNGGAGVANWTGENVSQVVLRDLRINGINTTETHVLVNEQVCAGIGQNYLLENVTTAGKITRANSSLGNTALINSKALNISTVSTSTLTYNGYVSGSIGGASSGATVTGSYSIIDGRVLYKGYVSITNPAGLASGSLRVSLPTFTNASGLSIGSFFGYIANTSTMLAGSCFANSSDNLLLFIVSGLGSHLNNLSYTWTAGDYLYFQFEYQML